MDDDGNKGGTVPGTGTRNLSTFRKYQASIIVHSHRMLALEGCILAADETHRGTTTGHYEYPGRHPGRDCSDGKISIDYPDGERPSKSRDGDGSSHGHQNCGY